MLEKTNLNLKLAKEEYKVQKNRLQRRLLQLQRAYWRAKYSVIIVIEGWDGAGKGSVIHKLTQKLDPRSFKLHSVHAPRTYEKQMPWLWRFWSRVPNWGEMAIFDHSWYGRVIEDRVEGVVSEEKWRKAYADINSFERTLAVDRYLFAKFFLHIDQKTQKKRFKKLENNPLTEWQIDDDDWNQNKNYDQYLVAIEEMLERTETEWAPWILVEATNHRWARIKVLSQLTKIMEDGLKARGLKLPPVLVPPQPPQKAEDENAENGTQDDAQNS